MKVFHIKDKLSGKLYQGRLYVPQEFHSEVEAEENCKRLNSALRVPRYEVVPKIRIGVDI